MGHTCPPDGRLSDWAAGKRRQLFDCGERFSGLSALALETWVMPARRCQDPEDRRKLPDSEFRSEARLQNQPVSICKGSHIFPIADWSQSG